MKEENNQSKEKSGRRNFLKLGLLAGGASVASTDLIAATEEDSSSGEKVKELTTDGELVEVDSELLEESHPNEMTLANNDEARKDIKLY